MRRLAPTLLVLALLVGSVAAFAVAERLKLEPVPLRAVDVDKIFSPVCDCPSRVANIVFVLRKPGVVSLAMLDDEDRAVSHVIRRRGLLGRVQLRWNGRGDDGNVLPEGVYRPRLELHTQNRTILMPNPIRLDSTRPRLRVLSVSTPVISPDGDRRRDRVSFRYRVSERAKVLAYLGERLIVESRRARPRGKLDWFGQRRGRGLPDGVYPVTLAARDLAGNLSSPVTVAIRVRYVELARERIVVRARTRFGVRVRSDARRFAWRIGKVRSGTSRTGLLILRAPRPGRYWLYVTVRGHTDRARLLVTKRR